MSDCMKVPAIWIVCGGILSGPIGGTNGVFRAVLGTQGSRPFDWRIRAFNVIADRNSEFKQKKLKFTKYYALRIKAAEVILRP